MSSAHPHEAGRVGRAAGVSPVARPRKGEGAAAPGFDRLLTDRLQQAGTTPLRWSAHAVQRLAQRQLAVTPEVQQRLETAVDKLAAKGGRESLVMVDRLAFVVSVPNRTVITAVDQGGMRDQVFTNIDSAVVS
jgi:flagellar operon protein